MNAPIKGTLHPIFAAALAPYVTPRQAVEFFDADSELPHGLPPARKPALYSVPDTFDAAKELAEEDALYAEHERQERARVARKLTFVGLDEDWLERERARWPNAAGQMIP